MTFSELVDDVSSRYLRYLGVSFLWLSQTGSVRLEISSPKIEKVVVGRENICDYFITK